MNVSFRNTPGNGTDLYNRDLTSYFATVDRLYGAGARKFVFNNLVPFDRAQIGVGQGPQLQEKMKVCCVWQHSADAMFTYHFAAKYP